MQHLTYDCGVHEPCTILLEETMPCVHAQFCILLLSARVLGNYVSLANHKKSLKDKVWVHA